VQAIGLPKSRAMPCTTPKNPITKPAATTYNQILHTFMNKLLPIVAIVGQPNAGKSSLMNKIGKQPLAITSDVSGTTRDRQYLDTSWNGVDFTLVDTAGLSLNPADELELSFLKQIEVALAEATAIILVADGKEPARAMDQNILKKFRSIKKPTVLAINKLDSSKQWEEKLAEFRSLGIKNLFPVSALSGRGIGDMLDKIVEVLPVGEGLKPSPTDDNTPIAISIVGKPNVGKSSIFNKILDEERVVVSPIAGTTRAAIDSDITIDGQKYTFIDTAGLKKKEHRQAEPDVFAGFQTFKSIRRSDVCFFVIDAAQEITKQDQSVANEIINMQKGCIILANKCDLLQSSLSPMQRGGRAGEGVKGGGRINDIGKSNDDHYQTTRDYISHHFPFLWTCPLFFVSGLTGDGLKEAVDAIKPIFERRHKTIEPEALKEFLQNVLKKNPPKLLRDQKKPKVFGLKQIAANPPMFELLVNHSGAISSQFRKFLENSITKYLDFYGTPITLKLRGKDKS
jgi:GTP-binding protein